MFKNSGKLLRIFIEESDKHEGKILFEWIVKTAKDMDIAGATVLRGLEGFGEHKHVHNAGILRFSLNLPVLIEIVDTKDKIENFLEVISPAIKSGLATLENIQVHFFGV